MRESRFKIDDLFMCWNWDFDFSNTVPVFVAHVLVLVRASVHIIIITPNVFTHTKNEILLNKHTTYHR